MRTFWRAFRRALVGIYHHNALGHAKGAAYSALLAFLPVLTATTAILAQINAEAVSKRVTALFFRVAPPGVEDLVRFQVTQRGSRPTVLPIAAVLLGMTMFEPGRCNVPGTLVGAATIGMLGNGLVLMGAPYYVQDIVLGIIIVASVALSASALKKAAFGI